MIFREMSNATAITAPQLGVKLAGIALGPDRGIIRVGWQLTNLTSEATESIGDSTIEILETWLPHGGFFGEREAFEPVLKLAAGESAMIERSVRYAAEPGEVVENAFLNLRVLFDGRLWRVLIRMRAHRSAKGAVDLRVEAVTAHRAGFAQAPVEDERPSAAP